MSAPLVCVDLDRTVIYSPAALALTMPDEQAPRLLCVEVYQGKPLSFITENAVQPLQALARESVLVPVTTRTPEQLKRVRLPLPRQSGRTQYAIASNGGHLLVDGDVDAEWSAKVSSAVAGCRSLAEITAHLVAVTDDTFVEKLRVASDLFAYAVVQRENLPEGWLDEVTDWAAEGGWRVSLQGRKVYFVPDPLTKSAVVEELRQRCGADWMLAAGDSLLDRDLLEIADRAVRPAAGELADSGWVAPHVHALETPGVIGGQLLVQWLLTESRATRQ